MVVRRKQESGSVLVGGVTVTHPDRVVYSDGKLTKLDVIRYYVAVADRMLPLVAKRPLTVVRCPEGQGRPCFYQKHVERGMPEAVGRVAIREGRGTTRDYPVVSDVSGLVALVQMGVLEIHHWGASTADVEKPNLIVFDIDPDFGLAWSRVVEAAFALRKKLESLGMKSWLKTTGGKGLHVVVPLGGRTDWDSVRDFTLAVVERLASEHPAAYTVNALKARRKGRIFLDYLRNGRGATAVAAYSTRARPGAPVATPIGWDELEKGIDPAAFDVTTVPDRIAGRRKDPWKDILSEPQKITAAALRTVER